MISPLLICHTIYCTHGRAYWFAGMVQVYPVLSTRSAEELHAKPRNHVHAAKTYNDFPPFPPPVNHSLIKVGHYTDGSSNVRSPTPTTTCFRRRIAHHQKPDGSQSTFSSGTVRRLDRNTLPPSHCTKASAWVTASCKPCSVSKAFTAFIATSSQHRNKHDHVWAYRGSHGHNHIWSACSGVFPARDGSDVSDLHSLMLRQEKACHQALGYAEPTASNSHEILGKHSKKLQKVHYREFREKI